MTLRRMAAGGLFTALAISSVAAAFAPRWPEPGTGGDLSGTDDEAVRRRPICVATKGWSAGQLGRTALYRVTRQGRHMTVGYFVHWSSERPWGMNLASYTLLPALLIDGFYTHLFFVLPGAQRAVYGPGDVEGARVSYQQGDDGRWTAVSAVADDAAHHEVVLAREDFIDDEGRIVLMTDVWSHQLGAPNARRFAAQHEGQVVCYVGEGLVPLGADMARGFRLGSADDPRRAPPAWGR